jgi:hypothetical protein
MTNVFNFTLYLRKETRKGLKGVAYYSDEAATIERCWNWWPSRPDRRNTSIFYNCLRYRVVWLADLEVMAFWDNYDLWKSTLLGGRSPNIPEIVIARKELMAVEKALGDTETWHRLELFREAYFDEKDDNYA